MLMCACVCVPSAAFAVFSNGDLDPWSTGGIMETLNPALPAVVIEEAGHHMDLFFSNPADTPSVLAARAFELKTIQQWLAAHAEVVAGWK
jgi:lysosomal Pro-X carboxypeptidase